MTPCTVNGKPTFRFVKTEQKSLVTVAALIHSLSFYDSDLRGLAVGMRVVVERLDEHGVYLIPTPTAEVK